MKNLLLFVCLFMTGCGASQQQNANSAQKNQVQSPITDQERQIYSKSIVYTQNNLKHKVVTADTSNPSEVIVTVNKNYDELDDFGRSGIAVALLRHYRVTKNQDFRAIKFIDQSGKTLYTKQHSGRP